MYLFIAATETGTTVRVKLSSDDAHYAYSRARSIGGCKRIAVAHIADDADDAAIRTAASDRDFPQPIEVRRPHFYTMKYRPPGFATCPDGYTIVEAGDQFELPQRTDIKRGRHRFGVIAYDESLSPDDIEAYEMIRLKAIDGQYVETPIGQAP